MRPNSPPSSGSSTASLRLGRFTNLGEAVGHYIEQTMIKARPTEPKPSGCRYADGFILARVPPINLARYCRRLVEYMRLDDETLIMGLSILRRVLVHREHRHSSGGPCPARMHCVVLTPFNSHRLLLVALIVAVKTHCDEYFPMSWYSVVGGVPIAELLDLEMAFLSLIGFELFAFENTYAVERMRLISDPCFSEDDASAPSSTIVSPRPGYSSMVAPTPDPYGRSAPRSASPAQSSTPFPMPPPRGGCSPSPYVTAGAAVVGSVKGVAHGLSDYAWASSHASTASLCDLPAAAEASRRTSYLHACRTSGQLPSAEDLTA